MQLSIFRGGLWNPALLFSFFAKISNLTVVANWRGEWVAVPWCTALRERERRS